MRILHRTPRGSSLFRRLPRPGSDSGRRGAARLAVAALFLAAGAACSTQLPPPVTRPLITPTGARLQATPERMVEVEAWVTRVLDDIETNPDFWIETVGEGRARYPWDALEIRADTAAIQVSQLAPDAETPYMIYAHLRLMAEMDLLEEWLPGVDRRDAYRTELAIARQIADVWLLGRTVFDVAPFGPLDELMYASEFGYLEDFVLDTQSERFATVAAEYSALNPGREEEFRSWFQTTFERRGPGFGSDGENHPPDGTADSTGPA